MQFLHFSISPGSAETLVRRGGITFHLGSLPVWRSGSVVRRINEVTLRQARLVLG